MRAGAGQAAYAKIAGAVVLSLNQTRTRHFVVAWGSFRSPTHYSVWSSRRELNRVKERSHEGMAR